MSRAKARAMVEAGEIHVNGRRPRKGLRLSPGDRVMLSRAPNPTDFHALPDSVVRLDVLHEDPWLVVIDKPAGMASHPLRERELGTVASGLVAKYPEMSGVGYRLREPGILHRLDTDTSGVLLAARDELTFQKLREALRSGEIDKRYRALVEGHLLEPTSVELPIAPHPKDPRRVCTVPGARGSRHALTDVIKVQPMGVFTLVEISASTATRHQVRAHMAALGHPLVGDPLYKNSVVPGLSRHFLHASHIGFSHPHDGRQMRVESELPRELAALIRKTRG